MAMNLSYGHKLDLDLICSHSLDQQTQESLDLDLIVYQMEFDEAKWWGGSGV